MVERALEAPWLYALLEGLHRLQAGLLQLLFQLGLVGEVHGQPAWPWALRIAGDNLLRDLGQARALAVSLLALGLALALLLAAAAWRRGRPWLLALAVLAVALAPWPDGRVLWQPAHATSFHQPAVPFSDAAIVRGGALYAQHCLACHGSQGNGQGPAAAQQSVWPPSFVSPLLWRRADGDLFWAVQHGLHDRSGRPSMPAFGAVLTDTQAWELLHYLRALGAGQLLVATGSWAQPVHLPDMQLHCPGSAHTRLADWQGQRLRLATTDPARLVPDPRLVTLWLPPTEQAAGPVPPAVDCVVTSVAAARTALGLVNGQAGIDGTQLLADRAGWLRARNGRGGASWSDEDMLCTTAEAAAQSSPAGAEDGLSRVIRLMDASPVRYAKGGRVH